MIRKSAALLCTAALLTASVSACAPVTKFQGYTAQEVSPAQTVVGTDNKQTVRTKFGSPTSMGSFDQNTWYYASQVTDRFGAFAAKPRRRDVIQITFDPASERVVGVKTYDLHDGRQVAYSKRETPTVGRTLNIWDQILGTIGQTLLPTTDATPGSAPGQPIPK